MAEGRRLRPALARRDRDAALQDHHRPNAPRPDSARTKGRGQGRLQGAQPHDRSRHARLSKARLKPPERPPLPPDLRLCTNARLRATPVRAAPRALSTAASQVRGSRGSVPNSAIDARPSERAAPVSSITTARAPEVPTSIPTKSGSARIESKPVFLGVPVPLSAEHSTPQPLRAPGQCLRRLAAG